MRPPRPRNPDAAWYPVAGLLLLGGPIWAELYQARYPFSSLEATLLPLAAGGVGLLAALLVARLREPLATVGFALLVIGFLDLQLDLEQRLPPLLVAVAALGGVALLRSHRGVLTVVMLGGFYVSSLAVGRGPERVPVAAHGAGGEGRQAADRPVLLHVILDGQWGPAGLQAAGDSATAADLAAFYASRGFRLFRGAYSRYSATRLSLGSLAALGGAPPIQDVGGGSYRLAQNPYFDQLERLGYRIRVFQSSHLNYCPPDAARAAGPDAQLACYTASSGSIGNVGHLRGAWPPRAALTLRFFLSIRSHLYVQLHGREPVALRRSAAGRAVVWAETVRRSIAAREAEAYFVHLIIPHAPFEVDSTCVGYPSVALRLANNDPGPRPPTRRLAAYTAQSRCAHRVLDGLLTTLDSVAGPRSIVVVHGDHGPKLAPAGRTLADYSAEALNHYFSTLFAVRGPSIQPGSVAEAAAIQDLLRSLVESGFESVAPSPEPVTIFAGPGSSGPDTSRVVLPRDVRWVPAAPVSSGVGGDGSVLGLMPGRRQR